MQLTVTGRRFHASTLQRVHVFARFHRFGLNNSNWGSFPVVGSTPSDAAVDTESVCHPAPVPAGAHLDTTTEVAAGILPASEGGFQPPGYNAHAPVASSATSTGLEAAAHWQTRRPPLRRQCQDAPGQPVSP